MQTMGAIVLVLVLLPLFALGRACAKNRHGGYRHSKVGDFETSTSIADDEDSIDDDDDDDDDHVDLECLPDASHVQPENDGAVLGKQLFARSQPPMGSDGLPESMLSPAAAAIFNTFSSDAAEKARYNGME